MFRRRVRPRLAVVVVAWAVALAAALWLGGLVWFAETLPRSVEDSETVTDGFVVFTGGSERLETAVDLLAAGKARNMFVSGVSVGVSEVDIQAASRRAPELFECCVALGYEALDTAGNARETAAWVAGEGHASLRVITAAYHMPRSLVELGRLMPDVRLIANPVFPERVRLESWWSWPGTATLFATEYTKYLVSLVRTAF
jgi:uncharacterized SAM-binding protein YcdF (DUF218 family)